MNQGQSINNIGINNNQQGVKLEVQEMVQAVQRYFVDTLNTKDKKLYDNYRKANCCGSGINGVIIKLIIYAGINFVLLIAALSTMIDKNDDYSALKAIACPNLSNMLSDYLSNYASLLTNSNLGGDTASFKTFWCDIGGVENGVLISYLIFIIFYLAFEILSLLIHKKVINLAIEGILHYILIGVNLLFLVIFYIYIALLFYLFIYCIVVSSTSPYVVNDREERTKSVIEENWDSNKAVPIVNSIFVFCIFIFNFSFLSLKYIIILYLNFRFENENESNERTNTKTLRINNQELKAIIKVNKMIYLQRVGQGDKIYKFKEMKFEGLSDYNIYVQLNNKAITDQLSLTSWEYPDLDELFIKLGEIFNQIYTILFLSIGLFKMHLNNEYIYLELSASLKSASLIGVSNDDKPKFNGVFTDYGDFESGTTNSRFALYIVAMCFILLSMLKRTFFGGYTRPIYFLIGFIASVVFILENIIYVILSFLMIIFSILSLLCYYDIYKDDDDSLDDMIQAKLIIQMILNLIIFSLCIKILYLNAKLTSSLNKLRKEVGHLDDGTPSEEQENIRGFNYTGLDNQMHVLNELSIERHPRYVYYTLYNDINNVNINQGIGAERILNNNNNNIDNQENQINIIQRQQNRDPPRSVLLQNIRENSENAELLRLRNENQDLRNTNRLLNEELRNLRNNLGNLYNSIRSNN